MLSSLRFLVESDNLDNPSFLARIRMMPSVRGKPVPVCSSCQAKIEAAPRRVAKPQAAPVSLVLGFLGVLSVSVLLGSLLNPRS